MCIITTAVIVIVFKPFCYFIFSLSLDSYWLSLTPFTAELSTSQETMCCQEKKTDVPTFVEHDLQTRLSTALQMSLPSFTTLLSVNLAFNK